jgi:uncharacterized protein
MSSKAEELEARLRSLRSTIPDLEAAVVVSDEGLVLASAVPGSIDDEKVSAMGGAMLTLGDRITRELQRGTLEQVMVRGENGYILLMPLGPRTDMMLAVMARADAKLGWIMLESRRIAVELSQMLA